MDPRVTSKDIEISGRRYRVNKMDARTACWIFSMLAAKTGNGDTLMGSLGKCGRQEFAEIQAEALKNAYTVDAGNMIIPIVGGNGQWADKDLGANPADVMQLMTESIMFSISSFLVEKESDDRT